MVVVGHGVVAISVCSAVWVVVAVATSVGPAAILVALIVEVWNNTLRGIAIWDIAEVAILVVVGHGVVAISVCSAIWVVVGTTSVGGGVISRTILSKSNLWGVGGGSGRVSVVPACPLVAMVIVDPVFISH